MARNEVLSRLWRPEKMDGADELTSSSSSSSSFSSTSSAAAAAAAATTDSESQEVHVLAVDDSLVDRKVIEKLLKITSCKVTAVDSGRRALQFLGLDEEKNSVVDGMKVDMIITDYCMPGMTGFELLKKIKGSSAFRQVPVVIMSSENILARIDSCFEEGAEDFIMKPVKLEDVKRLKDSMFGGDRKLVKQETGICKRKLQVTCDENVSSSNDPLPTTAATTPSPPSSTSSSPPSSPKSFSSSSSSSSAPSADLSPPTSPTTILNSQARRLKISNYDLQ